MQDALRKAIKQGGITLRLTGGMIKNAKEIAGDFWYYPVFPDDTLIVPAEHLQKACEQFAATHALKLSMPNRYLGLWKNPKDQKFYIDISERAKSETNANTHVQNINARSNRQIIAIYNPTLDSSHPIGS